MTLFHAIAWPSRLASAAGLSSCAKPAPVFASLGCLRFRRLPDFSGDFSIAAAPRCLATEIDILFIAAIIIFCRFLYRTPRYRHNIMTSPPSLFKVLADWDRAIFAIFSLMPATQLIFSAHSRLWWGFSPYAMVVTYVKILICLAKDVDAFFH